MKKLLLLVILCSVFLSTLTFADYVSPLKYQNVSCENMQLEYDYMLVTQIDIISEKLDVNDTSDPDLHAEYVRLNELYGDIEMEVRALETAMKRVKCKIPDSVGKEK